MESSIAGMLILSVLIIAVVLMSRAYVVSNTLLGTAMVESVNRADERSRTELSIESWDLTPLPSTEMSIKVKNVGDMSIADYDKMDVFIGSERLEYATSTPALGTWTLRNSTTTWSHGKIKDIEIRANSTVVPGATVVISPPSGVTEVGSVPTPTPTPTPAPTPTPTPNQVIVSCNNPTVTPPTITATTTSITVTCP